ncbi:MAG: GMC family oxidoreductase [Deltaproteobacteria bacterium]|nr:GMC family oxidoreductase [Deltaproteobacteria bacterium]
MNILSKREREILEAFAETLIPLPSSKLTYSIADSKLADKIEDHIRYFSKDVRLSFRIIIFLFDYGAFFYRLKCRTFRKMDALLKSRYLEAWHKSKWAPKRALWRFLDAIVYINYYSIPHVAAQVGYTPKFKPPKPSPEFKHENAFITPFDHDIREECDVCVIGSGAGGAVIAKTLAEAGRKVVILEEGGYYRVEDFGQDALSETKLMYRNGGIINTFGWPAILVPVGRCVGGTTTINSGTCFRTPPNVLEKWVNEFGLSTWNPERMERYYDSVEKTLGVERAADDVLKKNAAVIKNGLRSLGYEGKPLMRNAPGCRGSGVCCFGCPTNAKQSTQLSYIPQALNAGAKLYAHCQASRFLYKGAHADTVIARFRHPDTHERLATLEVKARVIILACGTLHTPVLLMRSHVPNRSGQIGHNLTLHPAAKVMGLFGDEIKGWDEIPQSLYMDALAGEGITLMGAFLPPGYVASTILHTGERHRNIMERYNNLASFGLLISDTCHGRILRMPGNRPLAVYNVGKKDLAKYVKGISLLAELFFKAGAESVLLPIHTIPELTSEDGVKTIYAQKIKAKDLDLQAFHPLGTCRMGADPAKAVADPHGRFYGLDNVFIADGSIFPTALGVNPMLTIMAAAAKIGDYVDREVL